MMDKTVIPVKYWREGRHVYLGEEIYSFKQKDEAKKCLQAIEDLDVMMGGIRHDPR